MNQELAPVEVARSLALWREHAAMALPILRNSPPRNIPAEQENTAIFVATRRSPFSEIAVRNLMYFLDSDWGLELCVAESMMEWATSLVAEWGDVRLHPILNPEGLVASVLLNRVMRTEIFWSDLEGDNLMLFDSGSLLRHRLPPEFDEFDFIGSPWHAEHVPPWCRVGSGGLSLRKKSAMLDVIDSCNTNYWLCDHEDIFYSAAMHLSPDRYFLPSPARAAEFSVEQVFHPNPVALHQAWKYQPAEKLKALLDGILY